MSKSTLKSILIATGNQCKDLRTGVICSDFLILVSILDELELSNGAFPLHGTARYGTAQFGSVAFPPQFSTAIEWAGLFTRRYNCAASTAVTSS